MAGRSRHGGGPTKAQGPLGENGVGPPGHGIEFGEYLESLTLWVLHFLQPHFLSHLLLTSYELGADRSDADVLICLLR